jgi:hypothetical protein
VVQTLNSVYAIVLVAREIDLDPKARTKDNLTALTGRSVRSNRLEDASRPKHEQQGAGDAMMSAKGSTGRRTASPTSLRSQR